MSQVMLAYSGNLESNVILKWLKKRGDEVICFIADIGQKGDLEAIQEQADKLGASDIVVSELQEELLTQFVYPALKANALYEGKCFLGEALATALIAKYQVEAAVDQGTLYVCHGAKSKGISQIRFELAYKSLLPKVQVISPWKDTQFLQLCGHPGDLIAFARQEGIPLPSQEDSGYHIKTNLVQTTYVVENLFEAHIEAEDTLFERVTTAEEVPEEALKLSISFAHGLPVAIENLATRERIEGTLNLYRYLDEQAARHGVGRGDVVVNRLMGIKWRELYEAPAMMVLWQAHQDLEGLVLDKQVQHYKDQLGPKIAECIYNGLCFGPEMRLLMAAVEESQEDVTGKVVVKLYKGASRVIARESVLSRYCRTLNRMEQLDAFDAEDVKGFLNIQSLRLQQRAQ